MENDIEYIELGGEIDPTAPQTIRTNGVSSGLLTQIENTFTYTYAPLTLESLQDTINSINGSTIYQPTFTGYGTTATTSYTINGNTVTYTVRTPQPQDIKEEELFYNFLEHLTLTRD